MKLPSGWTKLEKILYIYQYVIYLYIVSSISSNDSVEVLFLVDSGGLYKGPQTKWTKPSLAPDRHRPTSPIPVVFPELHGTHAGRAPEAKVSGIVGGREAHPGGQPFPRPAMPTHVEDVDRGC